MGEVAIPNGFDAASLIVPAVLLLAACAFMLFERLYPARRGSEGPRPRDLRNFGFAATTFFVLFVVERPLIQPLAAWIEAHEVGLLALPLPVWAGWLLAFILLDWTMWLWHALTHRIPLLWRFHRVHHADLDMSASTALRLHVVELLAGVPVRAVQVMVFGIGPGPLDLWRMVFFVSILFHHSNWRLWKPLEAWLSVLIVTPRLHAIHHSARPEERNTNFSQGLSIWDYIHGTARRRVIQPLVIGDAAVREPAQAGFGRMLMLYFPLRDFRR